MIYRSLYLILFLFSTLTATGQRSVQAIRAAFLDASSPEVLVALHRAAHNRYPENSLKAIQESIRLGVDIIEIDVKVSKDGIPFLMHDGKLDRTTTGRGDPEQFMSALCADIEGRQIQLRSRLPMVSAHRGASKLAPENTLSAFSKAIEAGANFIEIDVRTTSDGRQVIMHDSSLKRTTGLDKRVEEVTLDAIKQLSAGNLADRSEKVPTLENVCELVETVNKNHSTTVKLYVDCKVIRAGDVVRILTRHHLLDSAVFYGNIKTLMDIKGLYDRARTMPSYPGPSNMATVVDKLKPYAFDVPFEELNAETIQACHSIGIKVFSDLLGQDDSRESYRKAIQLGVDLIQTDDVPAVIQAFKEFE